MPPPEYNVTGHDYAQRGHFTYHGPLLDIHAHVMLTRPADPSSGPPLPKGPDSSIEQAEIILNVAQEFGIEKIVSMCYPDDIPPLRERFGHRLHFNGYVTKRKIDDPDDAAYKALDRYLELGVKIIKFWSAPRGQERGLYVDAPWRIECAKRARAAGVKIMMVHIADPDVWFRTVYTDSAKFGTKPEQYARLETMLNLFPDVTWIGAHMCGDPEHPDHLEALLERYPQLHIDTSATKWQVREVSPRREVIRALICKYPDRFLFGSDLVTHHGYVREHYVSRYWCQRTLWESDWKGPSPIVDGDYKPPEGGSATPTLHGLALPAHVLEKVYYRNALRLLA